MRQPSCGRRFRTQWLRKHQRIVLRRRRTPKGTDQFPGCCACHRTWRTRSRAGHGETTPRSTTTRPRRLHCGATGLARPNATHGEAGLASRWRTSWPWRMRSGSGVASRRTCAENSARTQLQTMAPNRAGLGGHSPRARTRISPRSGPRCSDGAALLAAPPVTSAPRRVPSRARRGTSGVYSQTSSPSRRSRCNAQRLRLRRALPPSRARVPGPSLPQAPPRKRL
mmetsp:Transcript_23670/g.65834  ORF Transcript_23670/g.65834 Transcript_23670/m.65834 type:complete len:225 (-) Transcript_23670:114-788(-)